MAKIKNKFLLAIIGAIFCFAAFFGGMTAFKASANTVTPTVTMEYGASIRIGDTGNGLRFSAKVANAADGYEYHIIIVPDKYFEQDVYTNTDGDILTKLNAVHQTLTENDTATVNDYICVPDEDGIIRACITNIAYSNSNLQFTGIAYVKATNGEILSYSENTMTRSVTQVASYALMDTTETYSKKAQSVLFDYIHKGYHEAVGTSEEEATADNLPALTISVAETVETSEFTGKAGEITGYKVMYGETELPELNCILVPKYGNVDFENGKISLKEDTASGEYDVTLDAPYLDEVATTVSHTNMRMFSENTHQDWVRGEYLKYVSIGYDDNEKAMTLNGHTKNGGMDATTNIVTYPIELLEKAYEDGYKALSFQVKINEELKEYAFFGSLGAGKHAAGLRIFATDRKLLSDGSNTHEYVTWENDANNPFKTVGDQGTGVKIYKDVFASDLSTTEYEQVVIDLEDFLSLYIAEEGDVRYLAFSVGALNNNTDEKWKATNSQFFLKDAAWLNETEYAAWVQMEKEAYKKKNYVAENMLDRWNLSYVVNSGGISCNSNVSKSYDNGFKMSLKEDKNSRRQAVNQMFMGADDLKYAYEKLGLTKLTITYKVNDKKLESYNNQNKVYDFQILSNYATAKSSTTLSLSQTNANGIEIGVKKATVAGTEVSYTLNLSDFFTVNKTIRYFIIDNGGLAGTEICFTSMTLSE